MRRYGTPAKPAVEVFKSNDPKISKITKTATALTKAQFKAQIKEGDIIITYPKTAAVPWHKRLNTTFNQWVQNNSFTSSKVVGKDAKEIIGYDANTKIDQLLVNTDKIESFLNTHEVCVILRHKKATDEIGKKVSSYMYDKQKKQTPYAFGKVFISLFKHLFSSEKKKEVPTDEASKNTPVDAASKVTAEKEYTLFCSSIINMAYNSANCPIDYSTDIDGDYAWPRDLLLAVNLDVIGAFFSKESGLTTKAARTV